MKVMKFGGTSVGTPQRISDVATLVSNAGRCIVVLSAMSGTTNSLLKISSAAAAGNKQEAESALEELEVKYDGVIDELYATEATKENVKAIVGDFFAQIRSLAAEPCDNEKRIVAFGELISTNLMHALMHERGINSALLPALDYMRTDAHDEPDNAYIEAHIKPMISANPDADLFITQGFICRNSEGEIDNLQRGGSDYTASLVGAAVNADEIQIWTDIDGMHNNDPRFVEGTKPVHNLHFEEAAELAYFGAKILHPTCILPAKLKSIPVRLLNTMQPDAEGTLINNVLRRGSIKAIAAKDNITAIKIKSGRMLLAYGFLKKVFEVFEKYQTPIDMITTSEVGVSVTVDNNKYIDRIADELQSFGTVTIDSNMVIICVVGDLEWHNRGFEADALHALHDIPVRMISYGGSNYNISFLVDADDKIRALRSLQSNLFA